jgi:hypothetical protein
MDFSYHSFFSGIHNDIEIAFNWEIIFPTHYGTGVILGPHSKKSGSGKYDTISVFKRFIL